MARTRTLTQLRDEVRQRANIEGLDDRFTDAELTRYINQSHQQFRLNIATACGRYTEFVTTSSFTAVAGTSAVSLPADLVEILGVDLYEGGETYPIFRMGLGERADFGPVEHASSLATNRDRPRRYIKRGATIVLAPVPDAAYPGVLYYLPTVTDLSGDSDTLDGIAGGEEWIVIDAAIKCVEKEDDASGKYGRLAAERDRLERNLIKRLSQRDASGPLRRANVRERKRTGRQRWGPR